MLAEPIFQFTEELSVSSTSLTTANKGSSGSSCSGRIIPSLRTSLKRPSKLELKINLNEQLTEARSPLTSLSSMHLPQSNTTTIVNYANSNNNYNSNSSSNNSHSHDRNNNFLNNSKQNASNK